MIASQFDGIDTETLRTLLEACRDVLRRICDIEEGSVDAEVVRILLTAEDLTGEFQGLLNTDPAIAGRILHASLAALANTQSALAIQAELARRAAPNN